MRGDSIDDHLFTLVAPLIGPLAALLSAVTAILVWWLKKQVDTNTKAVRKVGEKVDANSADLQGAKDELAQNSAVTVRLAHKADVPLPPDFYRRQSALLDSTSAAIRKLQEENARENPGGR